MFYNMICASIYRALVFIISNVMTKNIFVHRAYTVWRPAESVCTSS